MHRVNGLPANPNITDAKLKRRIPPVDLFGLYATAMKIIMNWPETFYEFLDAFASQSTNSRSIGLHVQFGSLYRNWISSRWNRSEFGFIQETFIRYLDDRKKLSQARWREKHYQEDSSLTDVFSEKAIPLRETARELGINPSRVKRMVEEGCLRRYDDWKDGPGWYKLIVKEDVLKLKRQSEKLLTLKEAGSKLGVTVNFMRTLSKSGLLKPERGPHVINRRAIMFGQKEIMEFWSRLTRYVEIKVNPMAGFVGFYHAVQMLTVIGVNSIGLMELMMKGEIRGYLLNKHQRISDLLYDPRELNNYITMVRKERGWLTRSDVAKHMGISLRRVSHLINEGILPVDHTCGSTKYFFLETVKETARHIFPQIQ
jgi:hypothetical protein